MSYDLLLGELQTYEDEYREYRELFESDGEVDPTEQAQLERIENMIGQLRQSLSQPAAANGNGVCTDPAMSGVKATGSTSSSPTMRVVPGAGGYEYEQHADGTIVIVKSPIKGTARTEVQKGTTGYNAILAEIGPFPASGDQPGTAPPDDPGKQPVEPKPGDREPAKAPGGHAAWDLEKAVQHLKANAASEPVGLCAQYTREAIEAGGVILKRTNYAKDYGPSVLEVGFQTVNTASYQAGDVVIMQNCPGHDYGHMQMYSGSQWISDYVQSNFWPYTSSRPQYAVYRFPL
jgi:hypothetical protein